MRILITILLPVLLFSQDVEEDYWIEWNDELTAPYQRDFAAWCYKYGAAHGDRGHTLVWLGKNETSWNVSPNGDDGKSLGPFGMLRSTALWVVGEMDIDIREKDIEAILENDRALAADMAIWYFEYWYEKHLEATGHKGLAWTRAIASYRYGYAWNKATDKWLDHANSWVRFFKTLFKITKG